MIKYANSSEITRYDGIESLPKVSKANIHTLSVFGSKSQFTKKYSYQFEHYNWMVKTKTAALHSVSDYDPEFNYYRVIALHGDVPNDNGDLFRWGSMSDKNSPEILRFDTDSEKYVYESFVGRGNFKNHNNADVTAAVGIVLDAIPNHEGKFVELLLAVDAKKDPDLVRGIDKGYNKTLSMGAQVGYSYCSHCGNKAVSEDQFCTHVKNHKAQMLDGKFVCEDNRKVSFIEISWVNVPADKNALLLEKVASKMAQKELSINEEEFVEAALGQLIYLYGEKNTRLLLDKIQSLKN